MTELVLGSYAGFALLVSLALGLVKLWAVIDAAFRPAPAYVAAGKQSKLFWLLILIVALVVPGFGLLGIVALVAAIVYLVDVRPAIKEITGGRGSSSSGGWRT